MLSIFNVVGIISIIIIAIFIIKMIIIILFPSKSTCPRSLLCRCSECLHRVLSSEASSVNKGFPYSIFSAFAIILQEVTALFHLFVLLASNTFCIDFDPLQTWPFMGPFEPSLYPVAPILIFTHQKVFPRVCTVFIFVAVENLSETKWFEEMSGRKFEEKNTPFLCFPGVHQQICAVYTLSEVESTSIYINIYFPHFKFKAAENTKGCYFAQLTELKWSGTVAGGIKSFLSKENETCSQAGLQLLEQIEPFLFCGKYKSRHFIRLMQAIISPFISSPKYGD